MGDIAQRGNRLTKGKKNLLEELGRVEGERSNKNRRAEIRRVHGELNKGYATGGRVGLKKGGKPWGAGPKPGTHDYMLQEIHKRKRKAVGGALRVGKQLVKKFKKKKVYPETEDLTHQVGPYIGDVGSEGGPRLGRGQSPKRRRPVRPPKGSREWKDVARGGSRKKAYGDKN